MVFFEPVLAFVCILLYMRNLYELIQNASAGKFAIYQCPCALSDRTQCRVPISVDL